MDPKGPISSAQRLLLLDSTAIMLVVIVPVIVATLVVAWWYRASNPHASRGPGVAYEGRVEFVVWSIPALTVLLLGGVIWIGSHQLDPRAPLVGKAPPLKVDVVSLDWKWLFIYPDQGVATVNQLTIPVGTPIEFRLTSGTVMNSFFVPQLGSQIYTMGGMTSRLNLLASEPGEYQGFSANFSGRDFSRMRFVVHARLPSEFDAWLRRVRSSSVTLDDAGLDEIMKPGVSAPASYGSAPPKLFERILDQTVAAPRGRQAGRKWCPPASGEGP
jgi:cytochrome o ubiquinol oxidase subunit 2